MKKTIILLILALIAIDITGCSKAAYNKVLQIVESPDKKYTAYVFIRDLGATTKASYQLSIFQIGEFPEDDVGNIFVSYEPFDVRWRDSRHLMVKMSKGAEVFKQEEKYQDLVIKYELN